MWKRIFNLDSCRELYSDVTPAEDRDETLLTRFPNNYQAFTYEEENKVLAFGIVSLLSINNVIMIDLFAIDKSIRGKGFARKIFNSFINELTNLWPECEPAKDHWLLEAYLHNVIPWCKIMNMVVANTSIPAKKLGSPIQLLSHNVTNFDDAYSEWQKFQLLW